MKKKKLINEKFSLKKFEVAKLKNLKTISGGDNTMTGTGTGDDTYTRTSKDCPNSSKLCKDITG